MPLMWVYQSSDFIGGLPAEVGPGAEGGASQSLTLSSGAAPILIDVTDNDNLFNEVDSTQSLTGGVTLNGTNYLAGDNICAAYYLENSSSGHMVTGFHAGTGFNGNSSGAVVGITSTVELVPGNTYTFDINETTYNAASDYNIFVACFLNGTRILTPNGERPVEAIEVGDLVSTLDHGAAKLLWHGRSEAVGLGNMAPFRIEAKVLGNDQPLFLSAQHRVLLGGPLIEQCFNEFEVLCPIKHLLDFHQVTRVPMGPISYHHLLFHRHNLLVANGALAESFLPGPFSMRQLGRAETVAPMLPASALESGASPARSLLKRKDAIRLMGQVPHLDLNALAPSRQNSVIRRASG